jgi:hypothetical protein
MVSRAPRDLSGDTYQDIFPVSRKDAEAALLSDNPDRISNVLVNLAFHDSDWQWVQNRCLDFIKSPFPNVRRVSIVCLGHLARIHGELEMHKVLPVLESLRDDPGGV